MSTVTQITNTLSNAKIADEQEKLHEKEQNGVKNNFDGLQEEFTDPFCNADNPQIISFQDVTSAAFKIKKGIEFTPCSKSHLSEMIDMDIFLKKEFLQFTGSFKERGARYALVMLTEEQREKGVISASLGNHAQGLSYHGWKLGIPVTVVMPVKASLMKIQKCRDYHATVIVQGADMGEAKKIALKMAHETGLTYINGYDHPHIMAGQGTIGLEIAEQVSNIDAVVVPVGGGGLIAGVATAIKNLSPLTKIIGVESEKCPSFTKALENKAPMYVPNKPTLADGLAVPMVGYNAFATTVPLLDKMIVVKEEWIALAILRLVELEKCVVEGAGASGLAAILAGHLDEFKGKRVVLLICGGNIDTAIFGRCLERGMAAEGRLQRFTVTVSDGPGGLSKLCNELAQLGVSIKDIMHERAFIRDVHSVQVKVICETRDWNHSREIRKMLQDSYEDVFFYDLPMAM
ncbi:L-threonine ammonia-lyase-like [Topomyia yanbarensis]|uniref:L-threonine ammonia-lyase-like n=1 Tax=Topomyia yanbarensis TaxID=2498891 RepID=UPI00273BBC5B|nr:L-threonine ammonia-lyase-like [Topomyia yanbarensis]XP_058821523.1 L-threonine ammonia-lyase-like [Topomyia yanbarensis]